MIKPRYGYLILMWSVILLAGQPLFCQYNSKTSIGFGAPELINLSLEYQFESNLAIDIAYGKIFPADWQTTTYTAGINYYCGKKSEIVDRPTIFIKAAFNSIYSSDGKFDLTTNSLLFKLGKEINLTESFGIDFEIGLTKIISQRLFESFFSIQPLRVFSYRPENLSLGLAFFLRI